MTKITVPDNCTGVELPGGRKIDARNGKVEIDDANAAYFAKNSLHTKTGLIVTSMTNFANAPQTPSHCVECVFTGWPWQKVCPKCGAEMKIQDQQEESA